MSLTPAGALLLNKAVTHRALWRFARVTNLESDQSIKDFVGQRRLVADGGTGFPAPRMLYVNASEGISSLGELVTKEWGVASEQVHRPQGLCSDVEWWQHQQWGRRRPAIPSRQPCFAPSTWGIPSVHL